MRAFAAPRLGLLLLALMSGCAVMPPHPDAYSFAVMGDTPYSAIEEQRMIWMIEDLNRLDLAFVVHVGDIKGGSRSPCTDELFETRKTQFNASGHPFIYMPGDNDWTDCRRKSNGSFDPLERLQKLRQLFFSDRTSLGARKLVLERSTACALRAGEECQCPGLPENAQWEMNGVLSATLSIPGSNNNVGFDAASDREYRCRSAANRVWLEQLFRLGRNDRIKGLAVFIQANPWQASRNGAFDEFLQQISEGAEKLGKPVLFVHGDTHTLRIDKPFRNKKNQTIGNLTRLETYGSPTVGWVKVTVDQNDPALFRIEPGGTYP
jgi:hypothetical protein